MVTSLRRAELVPAIEFGLELAKRMTSSETSQAVAESINYQRTG